MRRCIVFLLFAMCLVPASGLPGAQSDSDFDHGFIAYSKTRSTDPVAQLQERLDSGKVTLENDERWGYLPAILKALNVPASSQSLVFSKTSLQFARIVPSRPRSLYFNDDVYVGRIPGSNLLEFAAVDPKLGAVFYTFEEEEGAPPKFQREVYACLLCHDSSATTNGVPGFMTLSVLPDAEGNASRTGDIITMTDQTPFAQRWGGWYVTGSHGDMLHRGNTITPPPIDVKRIDWSKGANLTSLSTRLDTSAYLTPTSDIVALMVLTHQTRIHNLITRANYDVQSALIDEEKAYKGYTRPGERYSPITMERIRGAVEPLVRGMFFANEAPLASPVRGVSGFQADFEKGGVRDHRGRSLKDLDLDRRLLRYPLSYLIYTDAFEALPSAAKDYFYTRAKEILSGADASSSFQHLSQADRDAIREILKDTKPDFAKSL
ncbi:MAG TPA: hypothetical protein VFY29_20525 [Terriglobia bacterium]|nr:hypothetical protein [Terriglobia bacterium]